MRHVLVVLFVLAAMFFGVAATDGQAAITVGSSLRERANLFTRCDASCTELQLTRPGGLAGATIPSDGVITRWRVRAATRGWVRLRILRPAADGTYAPVAASEPAQLSGYHAPGQDVRYEFQAQIPVVAGDVLALDRDRAAGAVFHGYGSDVSFSAATFAPALGDVAVPTPPTPPIAGRELLLNADVERDADGDGLGDESQDRCPAVPASTPDVPCPVTSPPPSSPTSPTPGYEGPVVQGEGGPTRPSGSNPSAHGSRPSVRPEPKAPRTRSKRHGSGRPTRTDPPKRAEEQTSEHAGGKPTRGNPPSQTKQQSQSHRGGKPKRDEPPATAPDQPSAQSESTPQRAQPDRPKSKKRRKHRGRAPQRNDPPPAPKEPTFEPHHS